MTESLSVSLFILAQSALSIWLVYRAFLGKPSPPASSELHILPPVIPSPVIVEVRIKVTTVQTVQSGPVVDMLPPIAVEAVAFPSPPPAVAEPHAIHETAVVLTLCERDGTEVAQVHKHWSEAPATYEWGGRLYRLKTADTERREFWYQPEDRQ